MQEETNNLIVQFIVNVNALSANCPPTHVFFSSYVHKEPHTKSTDSKQQL
jgi:hypothetical protein